jgi:hypothetical protein
MMLSGLFKKAEPKEKQIEIYESNPGAGDWLAYDKPHDLLFKAAEDWAKEMKGIEKPWLCWNVSERWCVLQQRLVEAVGWTPVVGRDPRYSKPRVIPGAVYVEFNDRFKYPIMYSHFPLEFIFMFADRFAFWHSDLLCRMSKMQELARLYESLEDGEMAGVKDTGGRRYMFSQKHHRYWELAACVTRGASKSQWDHGCGWWRPFFAHPNCPRDPEERRRRQGLPDHGFGAYYWKKHYGGRGREIPLPPLVEGHCTSINREKDYKRVSQEGPMRNMGIEIDLNYSIEEVCKRLDLTEFLDPPAGRWSPGPLLRSR